MNSIHHVSDNHYDSCRGIDFIGVNVIFVCHDAKGNILFHKRSKNCRDEQGRWDCGAGAMEFGETFEEAVRREVKEEYGTEPLLVAYVDTRNVIRTHDSRTTHWVVNLHAVLVDPEKVKLNDPHKMDEIGWFTYDNLPSPLHSEALRDIERVSNFLSRKRT